MRLLAEQSLLAVLDFWAQRMEPMTLEQGEYQKFSNPGAYLLDPKVYLARTVRLRTWHLCHQLEAGNYRRTSFRHL